MRNWILGEEHSIYGTVIMMGYVGEAYRWFIKDGVISMIPLSVLHEMEDVTK